jgi:hypothetical protein
VKSQREHSLPWSIRFGGNLIVIIGAVAIAAFIGVGAALILYDIVFNYKPIASSDFNQGFLVVGAILLGALSTLALLLVGFIIGRTLSHSARPIDTHFHDTHFHIAESEHELQRLLPPSQPTVDAE